MARCGHHGPPLKAPAAQAAACRAWQFFTDVYSKRDGRKVDRVVCEHVIGEFVAGVPHKRKQLAVHADGALRGSFTSAHGVAKGVTVKTEVKTPPLKGKGKGYIACDVDCDTRALSQYDTGSFHCRVLAEVLQGDLTGERDSLPLTVSAARSRHARAPQRDLPCAAASLTGTVSGLTVGAELEYNCFRSVFGHNVRQLGLHKLGAACQYVQPSFTVSAKM